jgi:hypothetical protein
MRTMIGGIVAAELLLVLVLLMYPRGSGFSPQLPYFAVGLLLIGLVMGAKLWQVRRVITLSTEPKN